MTHRIGNFYTTGAGDVWLLCEGYTRFIHTAAVVNLATGKAAGLSVPAPHSPEIKEEEFIAMTAYFPNATFTQVSAFKADYHEGTGNLQRFKVKSVQRKKDRP